MRVAIVGSRTWTDRTSIQNYVTSLPSDAVVISGGARGVDTFAENAALERGLRVVVYTPDWDNLGKSAGMVRNRKIVADAEELIAFWDGQSKGTLHSITLALNSSNIKKVTVIKTHEGD